MAIEPNAEPFGGNYGYGGDEEHTTWDEDRIFGCVCDSSWTVGFGPGEYQATEWFEPDCSKKHCPSGDDPWTADNEEDCEFYADNGRTLMGVIATDGSRYATEADAIADGKTVSVTPTPTPSSVVTPAPSGDPQPAEVVNAGAAGNKCFVECSNRGVCDYSTGTCKCFDGYYGAACNMKAAYVKNY